MSTTPNLLIPLIASNQALKEVTANTAFISLEGALTSNSSVTMTDANLTLNPTVALENMVLIFNGPLTATRTVTLPSNPKLYVVKNGTSGGSPAVLQSLIFKVGTGANTVTISDGNHYLLHCDGVNSVFEVSAPTSATGTVTSIALTLPAWLNVAGSPITASGTLAVTANASQTAGSFLATPAGTTGALSVRTIVVSDLAGAVFGASGGSHSVGAVPDPGASAGSTRFLREDGTWVAVSGGGGGTVTSVTFTGDGTILSSTPSSAVTSTGTVTATLVNTPTGTGKVVLQTGPTINGLVFPTASGSATPTVTQTVASGTQALNTSAVASGAASTVISTAVAGVLATDTIMCDFSSDPSGITGYAPSASGMLTIIKFCTAGHINLYTYNNTATSITPGACTLNYRVVR